MIFLRNSTSSSGVTLTSTVSLNHAFQKGSLSIGQKRGIISLILKKNKDRTLLENLRPILQNSDKIYCNKTRNIPS